MADYHGHEHPEFTFFAQERNALGEWEPLFTFRFSRIDEEDIAPRLDCVRGSGYWNDGDRIGYHTAYCFFAHQDPGHHDYRDTIRFLVQAYGATPQINDRFMPERIGQEQEGSNPQGFPPYPYEKGVTVPVDTSRPGGVVEVIHLRRTDQYNQLIYKFEIPAVSAENPKVKWYYQLGGLFVAVHDDLGPVARVILTSIDPNYGYKVVGIDSAPSRMPDGKMQALIDSCSTP